MPGTVALHYQFSLYLAGALCEVETNDERLLQTLCKWGDAAPENRLASRFAMKVVVAGDNTAPREHPHFRGMHHVVIASFGHANVFVFDLLRKRVTARVTEQVACDPQFWNERLLPIAVGVFGPTVGVVPVHCACLCLDGEGVLVAGPSGAGKSTISVALVQAGFGYVSDDWTYISQQGDQLLAHGVAAPIKLLPDAVTHYPQLKEHPLTISLNGELAYEVAPEALDGQVLQWCEPKWCLFLERSSRAATSFTPMNPEKVRFGIHSGVERLPEQLAEAANVRSQIIEHVAYLPSWKFAYRDSPRVAAEKILRFLSNQNQVVIA